MSEIQNNDSKTIQDQLNCLLNKFSLDRYDSGYKMEKIEVILNQLDDNSLFLTQESKDNIIKFLKSPTIDGAEKLNSEPIREELNNNFIFILFSEIYKRMGKIISTEEINNIKDYLKNRNDESWKEKTNEAFQGCFKEFINFEKGIRSLINKNQNQEDLNTICKLTKTAFENGIKNAFGEKLEENPALYLAMIEKLDLDKKHYVYKGMVDAFRSNENKINVDTYSFKKDDLLYNKPHINATEEEEDSFIEYNKNLSDLNKTLVQMKVDNEFGKANREKKIEFLKNFKKYLKKNNLLKKEHSYRKFKFLKHLDFTEEFLKKCTEKELDDLLKATYALEYNKLLFNIQRDLVNFYKKEKNKNKNTTEEAKKMIKACIARDKIFGGKGLDLEDQTNEISKVMINAIKLYQNKTNKIFLLPRVVKRARRNILHNIGKSFNNVFNKYKFTKKITKFSRFKTRIFFKDLITKNKEKYFGLGSEQKKRLESDLKSLEKELGVQNKIIEDIKEKSRISGYGEAKSETYDCYKDMQGPFYYSKNNKKIYIAKDFQKYIKLDSILGNKKKFTIFTINGKQIGSTEEQLKGFYELELAEMKKQDIEFKKRRKLEEFFEKTGDSVAFVTGFAINRNQQIKRMNRRDLIGRTRLKGKIFLRSLKRINKFNNKLHKISYDLPNDTSEASKLKDFSKKNGRFIQLAQEQNNKNINSSIEINKESQKELIKEEEKQIDEEIDLIEKKFKNTDEEIFNINIAEDKNTLKILKERKKKITENIQKPEFLKKKVSELQGLISKLSADNFGDFKQKLDYFDFKSLNLKTLCENISSEKNENVKVFKIKILKELVRTNLNQIENQYKLTDEMLENTQKLFDEAQLGKRSIIDFGKDIGMLRHLYNSNLNQNKNECEEKNEAINKFIIGKELNDINSSNYLNKEQEFDNTIKIIKEKNEQRKEEYQKKIANGEFLTEYNKRQIELLNASNEIDAQIFQEANKTTQDQIVVSTTPPQH